MSKNDRIFVLQSEQRLSAQDTERVRASWNNAVDGIEPRMRAILMHDGITVRELSPSRIDVIHVSADDWGGIYLNGSLVYEDHIAHTRELEAVVRALGGTMMDYEVDDAWMEDQGRLPEKWEDVQWRQQ